MSSNNHELYKNYAMKESNDDELPSENIQQILSDVIDRMRMTDQRDRYILHINDDGYTVFLSDYVYWAEHYDDLIEWIEQFDSSEVTFRGMTVCFISEQLLTQFLLRWT